MKSTSQIAIERACSIAGSQAALAKLIKVAPTVVNQWIKGVRPIPSKHCPKIESATCGEVLCEDLLPDFDWGFLRSSRPSKRIAQSKPPP